MSETKTEASLVVQTQGQTQALAASQDPREVELDKIATLMTRGDISKMTKPQQDQFLVDMALAHNLSPWPPPFMIIPGQGGKQILYATKACADRLRKNYRISIKLTYEGPLMIGDKADETIYCVKALATMPDGRQDEDMGCVSLVGVAGEAKCNAILKAVTKAKRRVTYTITGLSLPDESELGAGGGYGSYEQTQAPSGPREIRPSQASVTASFQAAAGGGIVVDGEVVK